MARPVTLRSIGFIVLLLGMWGLMACSAAREASAPRKVLQQAGLAMSEAARGVPAEAPAAYPAGGNIGAGDESQALQGILDNRKVIRNAELTIVVEDTPTAVNQLRSLANAMGGYVADANLWQVRDSLMQGSVTLRIDARRFDDALDRIREIALEVQRETIGSQDVTQEYTDLKSRLRNLEATEQELLALLSDIRKQTHSAEEILQVYRQLTQIREQIEQIKGRVQLLDNQINLATITISLIPKEEKPILHPGWQPGETFRDALGALASAGQGLVNTAIWLVVFVLPVGFVVVLPVALVIAGIRRWRAQPARESA